MRWGLRIIMLWALAALVLPAVAGKLYRWVDENGNVHYTDKIPPSQVELGRQELNEEGVTTRMVDRAKTREEVEKERELERLRQEQQRLIEEQKAADRVLLRTFRSEDDLIMARNGKLEAIDVMIKVAEGSIRRYQAKLADMQHRAATAERSGRAVPAQLVAAVESTLKAINDGYQAIARRQQEQEGIRRSFAKDLERFRELKRLAPRPVLDEDKVVRKLDNLLPCGDASACAAAWERAEAFVKRHATTPIQMLGDTVIMTAVPVQDADVSITVSRIVDRDDGQVMLFMDLFCKDSPLGKELCAGERVSEIRAAYRHEVGGATP